MLGSTVLHSNMYRYERAAACPLNRTCLRKQTLHGKLQITHSHHFTPLRPTSPTAHTVQVCDRCLAGQVETLHVQRARRRRQDAHVPRNHEEQRRACGIPPLQGRGANRPVRGVGKSGKPPPHCSATFLLARVRTRGRCRVPDVTQCDPAIVS